MNTLVAQSYPSIISIPVTQSFRNVARHMTLLLANQQNDWPSMKKLLVINFDKISVWYELWRDILNCNRLLTYVNPGSTVIRLAVWSFNIIQSVNWFYSPTLNEKIFSFLSVSIIFCFHGYWCFRHLLYLLWLNISTTLAYIDLAKLPFSNPHCYF